MSIFYIFNLSLILMIISFNKILNEECTSSVNIGGRHYDEQKRKCYSLSQIDKNNDIRCCIHKKDGSDENECIKQSDSSVEDDTLSCPKNPFVPNNCGIAGVYQPEEARLCKEISLVQGYCCYVKVKRKSDNSESVSCLRTRKLNKNKKEATNQMINYVGNDYTIESVDCHGSRIKYYYLLIIATIILL